MTRNSIFRHCLVIWIFNYVWMHKAYCITWTLFLLYAPVEGARRETFIYSFFDNNVRLSLGGAVLEGYCFPYCPNFLDFHHFVFVNGFRAYARESRTKILIFPGPGGFQDTLEICKLSQRKVSIKTEVNKLLFLGTVDSGFKASAQYALSLKIVPEFHLSKSSKSAIMFRNNYESHDKVVLNFKRTMHWAYAARLFACVSLACVFVVSVCRKMIDLRLIDLARVCCRLYHCARTLRTTSCQSRFRLLMIYCYGVVLLEDCLYFALKKFSG